MKHIKLFEAFSEMNTGIPASNLSKKEYWEKFDYDESTANDWANDPGYQALEKHLGVPLDYIQVLCSETAVDREYDEIEKIVEEIEEFLGEGADVEGRSIKSNQEYVIGWEYYPELGIAVANGDGGAPDWYFITPTRKLRKLGTWDEDLSYEENVKIALKKDPSIWGEIYIPDTLKNSDEYKPHRLLGRFGL